MADVHGSTTERFEGLRGVLEQQLDSGVDSGVDIGASIALGGSLIIVDLDAELTVAYVMNRMEGGLVGDLRGATVAMTAAMAAAD